MKALILNTQVCQVEEQDFPVAEPLYWVDCPNNVTSLWTYDNGQFVAPVIPEYVAPPAPTKEQLMAELAALTAKIQALGV